MDAVEDRPLGRDGAQKAIGVLALAAAILSVGIYVIRGSWPAGLGGFEPVVFLVLGIGFLGYAWLDVR